MPATERYFAYGSNMSSRQMAERCPQARSLGRAQLAGYVLTFDRWSARRGGFVADVVPAPRQIVWGVLWEVSADDLAALDGFEGVAAGAYRREIVTVRFSSETLKATTYRVCNPVRHGPPSASYLAILLEGAREHGLPRPYEDSIYGAAGLGPTLGKS